MKDKYIMSNKKNTISEPETNMAAAEEKTIDHSANMNDLNKEKKEIMTTSTPAPAPAPAQSKTSLQLSGTAKTIWEDIKNLTTNAYGITVKVFTICEPLPISTTELYLKLKNPSSLVSVEEAICGFTGVDSDNCVCKKYTIDLRDKYGVVSINPKLI